MADQTDDLEPTDDSSLLPSVDESDESDDTGGGDEEPPDNAQARDLEKLPEQLNLAEFLDDDELDEIGELCFEEYVDDEASRQPWLERQTEWIKIYHQRDVPKNPPWRNSSKETLPILAEGCNLTHARLVRSFLSTPDVIHAVPIGKVDDATLARTDRVAAHMNFQVTVQDIHYFKNKDRLFQSIPLHGSHFTKTFRDPVNKRNVVENVRAVDLVVPYGVGPRNIEEVERTTQIIWKSQREANYLKKIGFFSACAEPFTGGDDSATQDAEDDASGQQQTGNKQESTQCKILEQHRYLDLDEDGIEEPYIVFFDAQTKKVLRISIRYEVAQDDVFDPNQMISGQLDMGEDGEPLLDQDTQKPVIKKGDPTNFKKAICYYSHYPYLENPDGFYGLGLGHLVGSTNRACNKILRQSIDAGTLQVTGIHFIDKRLGIKKGPMEIEPGKMISVEATGKEIKDSVHSVTLSGPSQPLIGLMDTLRERADRLAGSTEILTGSPDKVMQPTTVMAMIEQGLQPFTAVQQRIHSAWESELNKLYRLNSIYLDDEEYFAINDLNGVRPGTVGRADYAEDIRVRPIADIGSVTQQHKIAKAQVEFETCMKMKDIAEDPKSRYQAELRFLRALGTTDIDLLLPKPPAQPPQAPPSPEEIRANTAVKVKNIEAQSNLATDEIRAKTDIAVTQMKTESEIESAKMKAGIPVDPFPGNGQVGQIGYPRVDAPPDNPNGNGGPAGPVPPQP